MGVGNVMIQIFQMNYYAMTGVLFKFRKYWTEEKTAIWLDNIYCTFL